MKSLAKSKRVFSKDLEVTNFIGFNFVENIEYFLNLFEKDVWGAQLNLDVKIHIYLGGITTTAISK